MATTPVSFDHLADSAFVREAQLVPAVLPFSAPTLWRKVRNGEFPKPTKLSANVTAWRVADVRFWLNERVAA